MRGYAGLKGNVVLYTTLMTVCHKGGQLERAMRIFRAMEGEGLQADAVCALAPGPHALLSTAQSTSGNPCCSHP